MQGIGEALPKDREWEMTEIPCEEMNLHKDRSLLRKVLDSFLEKLERSFFSRSGVETISIPGKISLASCSNEDGTKTTGCISAGWVPIAVNRLLK